MAGKIIITIAIEVPEGATVSLEDGVSARDESASSATSVFADAKARIRPFLGAFADQARAHGIRIQEPDGHRQDYRNVYPPAGYGNARLGFINITSGRYGLPGVPELADDEPLAQVYRNNGQVAGAKIYLTSSEAVAAAVQLTLRALEAR